jgi:hypothetical protein
MAQWLRFMLSGGVVNGKRLVSEKAINEATTKQINIGGTVDYGLGWFLRQWNKHKVVEHGGNIDGFNSQVAFMPDQKLGFVLLTNVTASTLGGFSMNTIWKNLVGDPDAAKDQTASGQAIDPKLEVGKVSTGFSRSHVRREYERQQVDSYGTWSATLPTRKSCWTPLQVGRAGPGGFLRDFPTNQRQRDRDGTFP